MKNSNGDWFKTHCAYCQQELPKGWFGKPKHNRPVPFDVYACSGRCEIALSDELDDMDGPNSAEYHREIKERWERMPSMPLLEYIKECMQRGVKP